VGCPSSLARSGEAVPSTGCVVSQPFATSGNRPYLDYWVIVAPEPSIERVAVAGHLMRGRICTHMMLWVLLWDSEV
jgi:hypothetical protein